MSSSSRSWYPTFFCRLFQKRILTLPQDAPASSTFAFTAKTRNHATKQLKAQFRWSFITIPTQNANFRQKGRKIRLPLSVLLLFPAFFLFSFHLPMHHLPPFVRIIRFCCRLSPATWKTEPISMFCFLPFFLSRLVVVVVVARPKKMRRKINYSNYLIINANIWKVFALFPAAGFHDNGAGDNDSGRRLERCNGKAVWNKPIPENM